MTGSPPPLGLEEQQLDVPHNGYNPASSHAQASAMEDAEPKATALPTQAQVAALSRLLHNTRGCKPCMTGRRCKCDYMVRKQTAIDNGTPIEDLLPCQNCRFYGNGKTRCEEYNGTLADAVGFVAASDPEGHIPVLKPRPVDPPGMPAGRLPPGWAGTPPSTVEEDIFTEHLTLNPFVYVPKKVSKASMKRDAAAARASHTNPTAYNAAHQPARATRPLPAAKHGLPPRPAPAQAYVYGQMPVQQSQAKIDEANRGREAAVAAMSSKIGQGSTYGQADESQLDPSDTKRVASASSAAARLDVLNRGSSRKRQRPTDDTVGSSRKRHRPTDDAAGMKSDAMDTTW